MHRSCTVSSIKPRTSVHPPRSCFKRLNCNFKPVVGLLTAIVLFSGSVQMVFALAERVLLTIRVMLRGWPPAHINANGRWKPTYRNNTGSSNNKA